MQAVCLFVQCRGKAARPDRGANSFLGPHAIVWGLRLLLRDLVSNLNQRVLQRLQRVVNVLSTRIGDADAHMPKSDIRRGNLFMQTAGENDSFLHETWQDFWRRHAVWKVNGSHAVGLILGLARKLLQAI
jgi:hypothetical protein